MWMWDANIDLQYGSLREHWFLSRPWPWRSNKELCSFGRYLFGLCSSIQYSTKYWFLCTIMLPAIIGTVPPYVGSWSRLTADYVWYHPRHVLAPTTATNTKQYNNNKPQTPPTTIPCLLSNYRQIAERLGTITSYLIAGPAPHLLCLLLSTIFLCTWHHTSSLAINII